MKTINLQIEELEERVAPTIVLTNPGGNTPNSENAGTGATWDSNFRIPRHLFY